MNATDGGISPAGRRRGVAANGTQRRRRKIGRRRPAAPIEDGGYLDRIARAVEREREHARVAVPERDAVWAHAFRCVCCGRMRGEQERREERSLVCIRCVREAGYWN